MARSTQDREWFLDGDPFYVDDEQALGQALGECITILSRLGGGIVIGANRQEMAPGVWQTVGYSFKWSSFMPGIRYREQGEVESESVPEPVEA